MGLNFDLKNFNNLFESWVKYEGSFKNDGKHGIGKFFLANGDKFFGSFKNDKLNG